MNRLAWLMLVLAACALEAAGPSQTADARPPLTVREALDSYLRGGVGIISRAASSREFDRISDNFDGDAAAWIREGGPEETVRRRLAAATFALEVGRQVFFANEDPNALSLLVWASAEMRTGQPSAGERLWRQALIAVLQGSVELRAVDRELNLARARFPDEPRWLILRAWHTEIINRTPPTPFRPAPLEGSAQIQSAVIKAYEDALRVPVLQAEAHTRLAFIRLSQGRTAEAIEHATEGAKLTTEPDIRLLAHLFRGWALTRSGRAAEAIEAYRTACAAMPTSQSAAMWLARSLFLDGQRVEAEAVVDATLRTGQGISDPWRLYPRGDIRLWPALIAQLREAIR